MPSRKRKVSEIQRENAKVAKTNHTIDALFKKNR